MNKDTPIAVYQMGKVGSQTIRKFIEQLDMPNPVYHIHLLSPKRLEKSIQNRISNNLAPTVQHNHARQLREYIENKDNPSLKIITGVREPVSQLISAIFQTIEVRYPHFIDSDGSFKFQEIRDYLYELILNYNINKPNQNCNWFDTEFKSALGINVYAYEFNHIDGYSIISSNNIDILILRLESSHVWNEAIAYFLDKENLIQPTSKNISAQKKYGNVYQKIISELRIPIPVLKKIYSSKYCQHFYTQEMIDSFIKKWSISQKNRKMITK